MVGAEAKTILFRKKISLSLHIVYNIDMNNIGKTGVSVCKKRKRFDAEIIFFKSMT